MGLIFFRSQESAGAWLPFMRRVLDWAIVVSALLSVSCQSSLAQTKNQSLDDRKIFVESFVISGTQAVDSAELAEITNSMAGSTFNDDAEELRERIRAQFQDRGYFTMEIQKLDIKVIDPLASPKPVRLEAQVSEGPRCRLSSIEFTGNHALSSEALRAKFPIKIGDEFVRSKIVAGLDSMRGLYGSRGFIESVFIPDAKLDSSSTVKLNIEVQEGPQYRMDKLEILGPPEVAEKLQTRWKLAPGAIFNSAYVGTFLERNSSLLPADFTQSSGVELFTDCRDATVTVHLHLTQDPQHAALDRTKHVDCPPPAPKKEEIPN
jgi:hemolysin activation/secretion protein